MDNVLIFGAGMNGIELVNKMHENPEIYTDTILGFIDNRKKEQVVAGYEVYAPEHIVDMQYDLVVIASMYEKAMYTQLIELGVSDKKIYFLSEYRRKCFSKYQFIKRNISNSKFHKCKTVIYTSITGNYDTLTEPEIVDADTDYICFTNNNNLCSKIWNIEYMKNSQFDDMHLAKYVKMFPHKYLKEYELSIWVDGKLKIKGSIDSYLTTYYNFDHEMLCFPHFERECIYEEASECIRLKKGNKKDIIAQIAAYYSEGVPFDIGLYEMGCIVRKHNDNFCKQLMEEWWEQIQKYSYRDQISFPYVCWKNHYKPDICDLDINRNSWFEVKKHNIGVKH